MQLNLNSMLCQHDVAKIIAVCGGTDWQMVSIDSEINLLAFCCHFIQTSPRVVARNLFWGYKFFFFGGGVIKLLNSRSDVIFTP